VKVKNAGAATSAAVTGTLAPKAGTTTAAGITGLNTTTPHAFGSAILDAEDVATGDVWTFDVLPAFNDGKPLQFVLTLTDGTTTWTRDLSIPVPWPGVSVTNWETSGATNDMDFLPDPGEALGLILKVTNTGTLATAGAVTGTMTWNAAGAPGSIVSGATQTFSVGPLAPAALGTSANPFQIQVGAGAAAHQTVRLDLALTDTVNTWNKTVALPIYAHLGTDPQEASISGVNLQAAYYWCDNTDLEIRIVGWGNFDAASARVSVVLADSANAAYRLRSDYGTVEAETWALGGWTAEATVPPSLTVTPLAGQTSVMTFRVKLADLTKLSITGKQAKMAIETNNSSGAITDALPDLWTGADFSKLVPVSWP
jgi:hypothetical protein